MAILDTTMQLRANNIKQTLIGFMGVIKLKNQIGIWISRTIGNIPVRLHAKSVSSIEATCSQSEESSYEAVVEPLQEKKANIYHFEYW